MPIEANREPGAGPATPKGYRTQIRFRDERKETE
jgi:hypothetical protein